MSLLVAKIYLLLASWRLLSLKLFLSLISETGKGRTWIGANVIWLNRTPFRHLFPFRRKDFTSLRGLTNHGFNWTKHLLVIFLLFEKFVGFLVARNYTRVIYLTDSPNRKWLFFVWKMAAFSWSAFIFVYLINFVQVLGEWNTEDYLKREHTLVKPYQGEIVLLTCMVYAWVCCVKCALKEFSSACSLVFLCCNSSLDPINLGIIYQIFTMRP